LLVVQTLPPVQSLFFVHSPALHAPLLQIWPVPQSVVAVQAVHLLALQTCPLVQSLFLVQPPVWQVP
jgi:hypothetical protein